MTAPAPRPVLWLRYSRRVTGLRVHYIAAADRGAAEYVTLAGIPLTISIHTAQPLAGSTPYPRCGILLGPCWGDMDVTAARELHQRWVQAGRDEEVIWRALQERYARLAGYDPAGGGGPAGGERV